MSTTVYQQVWKRTERPSGVLWFRLRVADVYENLYKSSPDIVIKDISFIPITNWKQEVHDEEGRIVDDEIEMEVSSIAARTENEEECFDFIVAAQDSTVKRYVLLEIKDVGSDEWKAAFRGVVRDEMSGQDVIWFGAEFSDLPTPKRVWKATVGTYEAENIDYDIQDLMIDTSGFDTWADAHVLKSPLFQDGDEDKSPHLFPVFARETQKVHSVGYVARTFTWGQYDSLVLVNDLLRYLMDRIETLSGGVTTIVFDESPLPFAMGTPHINPYLQPTVSSLLPPVDYTQYLWGNSLSAWQYRDTDVVNDAKLGDGLEAFYVQYNLIRPQSLNEVPYSWLRYKTFVKLVYGLARSLGMFPEMRYDVEGTLHIRFVSLENMNRDADGDVKVTYLQDAEDAATDNKPTELKSTELKFSGAASPYALEGDDTCGTLTDDEIEQSETITYERSELFKTYPPTDNMLAVTIGVPTFNQGESNGRGGVVEGLHMYGAQARKVFTNEWILGGNVVDPEFSEEWLADQVAADAVEITPSTDSRHGALCTTIFLPSTDTITDYPGETRTYNCIRPVSQISIVKDDVQRDFTELAEYVNQYQKEDARYYQSEYQITVPYLAGFRRTPDGANSFFNVDIGSTITLDSIEYIVIGIERDLDNMKTKLRLQFLARFAAYAKPTTVQALTGGKSGAGDDAGTSKGVSKPFTCQGDVKKGQAVSVTLDGKIMTAHPLRLEYGKVVGIALQDGADGEAIEVCTNGPCTFSHAFSKGVQLWLRTPNSAGSNVSDTRITSPTQSEHVDQRLGVVLDANTIFVEIGRSFVWFNYQ